MRTHHRPHPHDDGPMRVRAFRGHGGPFGPGGFGPGFGPFGPGFGPGGHRRGRARARRGDIRLVLLSLLGEQESNGYGLIRTIAERTNEGWKPSPGSVYPTLQQLVDEGLVDGGGTGRGDAYRVTDAGRDYLAENDEAVQAAWGAVTTEETPDELWSSFGKLAMAVRQFGSEATPEQRADAAARLDAVRRSLYATLAE